jgi:hypothetical protein
LLQAQPGFDANESVFDIEVMNVVQTGHVEH